MLWIAAQQGLSLLSALVAIAAVAAPVAWMVAKLAATHGSKRLLQSHKSELDRQLETHKAALAGDADQKRLLLKRQELMFAREFDAAEAFARLFRKLYPKPRFPEAEWLDAQVDIAENIGAFEKGLETFLADHCVAISADALRLLEAARTIAADTGFEVGADTGTGSYEPGQYPSEAVRRGVEALVDNMRQASDLIRQNLRTGSLHEEPPIRRRNVSVPGSRPRA